MRMRGFVAFDIETNGLWDDESNTPPSILCVVTMRVQRVGMGLYQCDERIAWTGARGGFMDQPQIDKLICYLANETGAGFPGLTWNGCGFDFRVLHAIASPGPSRSLCRELVLAHIDPMFAFFCQRGFPVALDSVARAAGTMRKSGSGADAAAMWAADTDASRAAVIAYCERDVAVLVAVAAHCESIGHIPWFTKRRDKLARSDPLDVLSTVSENLSLPEVDNSWFGRDRPTRAGFVGWLETDK